MFRGISQLLLLIKRPGSLKWAGEFCVNTHTKNLCRSSSVIKLQKYALREENTLSKKVIEYMRSNPEYATSFTSTCDHIGVTSPLNTFETHQLILRIADSKESKPCEILSLFTQYVSQKQDILQDGYTKRKILLTIKERVFQTLPQMTFDDLRKLALILKYLNFKEDRYLTDVAIAIDNECVKRASMVDLEQCLKFYEILLSLHGSHLHGKKQFNVFQSLFVMHTAKAKPHHLVQILHYIGAARKNRLNKEYIKVFITKLQEIFEQLSFIDAGIALEALFKCNIKLDKSFLLVRKTTKCLQMKVDELEMLSDLESYAFVAMIKVLRAARYHEKALLRSVSNFVVKSDANNFKPQVLAHTLALYANSQVYDPDVFTKLECLMLKHLSEHSHYIRSKDVSRLLWSFSHVGHKLKDNCLETVEKVLAGLLHKGEFDYYPEHLSGSLFSLAVLGHYPRELIEEAFKPHNIEKLQGKKSFAFTPILCEVNRKQNHQLILSVLLYRYLNCCLRLLFSFLQAIKEANNSPDSWDSMKLSRLKLLRYL